MPSITQTKILPHNAHSIYQLIMDIEKYPEFLPWCKQAKIIEKVSDKNLRADLLINFKNFFEKYRSDVKHGKNKNGFFVDVVAVEGPFKSLVNRWQINDLENEQLCEVKFFIEFEFN